VSDDGQRPRVLRKSDRFDFARSKVLAVDDSQSSLDIIAQVLLGFGVRNSTTCRTVAEAMEKLETEPFDLIIADAEMPGENGFDLTYKLRRQDKGQNMTTPVIISSGYTPLEKVHRARNAGANLVILKPIVPGVLLSHIKFLAKTKRDFVQSPNYCGPDRRVRKLPLPDGVDERRAENLKLLAQHDRVMAQNEIDSLFD
jgi:CheY-like chemotaxis protein